MIYIFTNYSYYLVFYFWKYMYFILYYYGYFLEYNKNIIEFDEK